MEDDDINKIIRLGKPEQGKSRPLQIVMEEVDKKQELFANLNKLKDAPDNIRKISVTNDLTKKERDEIRALTHWGRVTHICVSKLTIIGSDNGLSPGRRQAIIWTNAGILLIRPLRTNFNEMLVEILTFSFTKMRLKVSSAKWRPFCLGLNVLNEEAKRRTQETEGETVYKVRGPPWRMVRMGKRD